VFGWRRRKCDRKIPLIFMTSVTGLSHLTLAVSDLDRSVAFYSTLLGFSIRMRGPSSAYLEAGTLWLALVMDPAVRRSALPEYSHAAFRVAASELPLLSETLTRAGVVRWQEADGIDSFYFLDPDGHKLELHTGDLRCRLAARAAFQEPGVAIYSP
jgi:catechol 2,3-dioxygenase-like lactoylglutathione lyase family enzyme